MKPDNQSEIENEIRETAALEASSAVTDLPNTVARNVNPFAETVNHTDTGTDVVVVVDIEYDPNVDVDAQIQDVNTDIDIDVDTHVDK